MSEIAAQDAPTEESTEVSEGLSVEEQATAIGWREDGDKSAEEFVNERNNHLGLALSNIDKLEGKIAEQNRTLSEMARIQKAQMERADKAGFDRAMAQVKAQKIKAVEEGDGDAFRAAEAREDKLRETQAERAREIPQNALREEIKGAVKQNVEQNPDLFDTREKAEKWQKEFQYQAQTRGLTLEQSIAKANEVVQGPKASLPSLDDGGSPGARATTFDSLPREAKDAYSNFKRMMPDYTKEEFMEDYNRAQ